MSARLGLGSAQFGLDYGISNRRGQCPPSEVRRILSLAGTAGVRVIDTAADYGGAEAVLGAVLAPDHGFRIVTKVGRIDDLGAGAVRPEDLETALSESLKRLNGSSLYALLFRRPDNLHGTHGADVRRWAASVKERGLAVKVGVSLRTPEEVDTLTAGDGIDIVQTPFSILDRRILSGGRLRRLKDAGIEVHARSVFLQGLLLMTPDEIPDALADARRPIAAFREAARAAGLSALKAALGFVLGHEEIDCALVGVASSEEAKEIFDAARRTAGMPIAALPSLDDADILNPARWPQFLIHHERASAAREKHP